MEKKHLKTNFAYRDGKLFVYPHLDRKKHSHLGLLLILFGVIILFLLTTSVQPTAHVVYTSYNIGGQSGLGPLMDAWSMVISPALS